MNNYDSEEHLKYISLCIKLESMSRSLRSIGVNTEPIEQALLLMQKHIGNEYLKLKADDYERRNHKHYYKPDGRIG